MVPFRLANPMLPQKWLQLLLKRKKKRGKVKATPNLYVLLLGGSPNNYLSHCRSYHQELGHGALQPSKNVVKIVFFFYKGNMPIKKNLITPFSPQKETVPWMQEIPTPQLKTEWLWNFLQITFWKRKECWNCHRHPQ